MVDGIEIIGANRVKNNLRIRRPKMKRYITLSIIVAMMIFLFGRSVIAEDPNVKAPKKELKTVKGQVSVTKNKEGNITAVYITTKSSVKYSVTLDAKGKELGEKMASKTVEAQGTTKTKNGQKWLTVENYNEVQKAAKQSPRNNAK
jgi:uncharacterized protein YpmS